MSTNQMLRNDAVRHAARIARLSNLEQQQMSAFIEEQILPDLLVRLRAVDPTSETGRRREAKLKKLVADFRDIHSSLESSLLSMAESSAGNMASMEIGSVLKSMGNRIPDVGIELERPSIESVRQAVMSQPIYGQSRQTWFTALKDDSVRRVNQQLQLSVANGESVPQASARIRSAIGTTAVNARTIARTGLTASSAIAREETYKANSDVISSVQYVATLDKRTSMICAGLDGKVFPIGEGPRPPQHPNCRSTTVPVVKSFSELGLVGDLPSATRSSLDGQVPESMTFSRWIKQQDADIQDEVLGKKNAERFRKGKVTFDSLVESRTMNSSQLRAAEGIA